MIANGRATLINSVVFMLGVGLAGVSAAEALRNQPPGSFGWARAGGKIAHVDDATAVTINPANLLYLNQNSVYGSLAFDYITADYRSPQGATAGTEEPLKMLPAAYASFRPSSDLAWGIGLHIPYGQSVEYDENFLFRYLTPDFSELFVVDLTPAIAWRVNDRLQLGGGLNLSWSRLELRQSYPWAALTGNVTDPDGRVRFTADGFDVGATIGVTWQVTMRQHLAATYRSSIDIGYDGDFHIDNIPPQAAAIGVTPSSRFVTGIKYPSILTLGWGIEVTPDFRLGVDVERLEWSNVREINLEIGNNAVIFPTTTVPADWGDTYTAGFGMDWKFAPDKTLRGGYWYLENPIPSRNQQPNLPESEEHVLTLGLALTRGPHLFDFAYGYVYYEDREVADSVNAAFNGTYQKEANIAILSYSYRY